MRWVEQRSEARQAANAQQRRVAEERERRSEQEEERRVEQEIKDEDPEPSGKGEEVRVSDRAAGGQEYSYQHSSSSY